MLVIALCSAAHLRYRKESAETGVHVTKRDLEDSTQRLRQGSTDCHHRSKKDGPQYESPRIAATRSDLQDAGYRSVDTKEYQNTE
jgi:hypothetical protein